MFFSEDFKRVIGGTVTEYTDVNVERNCDKIANWYHFHDRNTYLCGESNPELEEVEIYHVTRNYVPKYEPIPLSEKHFYLKELRSNIRQSHDELIKK